MNTQHRFSKLVFRTAGIYGIIVLLPMYLIELGIGPAMTAPIQHPEHFYGFIGVALVWQVAFLLIALDVQKYRLLMLPSIMEKLVFGVPALVLYAKGRVGADVLLFGSIDIFISMFFILAFRETSSERHCQVEALAGRVG